MRDPETGASRGFAFISYDSFEAADAAIAMMNGQFLANRPVNVSFALKKDGKGERHGSEAGSNYFFLSPGWLALSLIRLCTERLLAAKNKPAPVAAAGAGSRCDRLFWLGGRRARCPLCVSFC